MLEQPRSPLPFRYSPVASAHWVFSAGAGGGRRSNRRPCVVGVGGDGTCGCGKEATPTIPLGSARLAAVIEAYWQASTRGNHTWAARATGRSTTDCSED